MVTYEGMFTYTLVLIGVITICIIIYQNRKNRP